MKSPKLGDVWELPPLPPSYDSNPKTKNSLVFIGTCYYDESDDDMSIINFDVPNDDFSDNEEYVLGMSCENAILYNHDDTLLQDSPIVFLNSPNHTFGLVAYAVGSPCAPICINSSYIVWNPFKLYRRPRLLESDSNTT
jgi:hypothetical protein